MSILQHYLIFTVNLLIKQSFPFHLMSKYSIKELAQLSGIKAHTIRIWEKRYQVITPKRTASNIRYYSDEDLKRILNIAILYNHGYKISNIVALTQKALTHEIKEVSQQESNYNTHIDQLSIAMVDMDEMLFESLLNDYINQFGFDNTVLSIIYPFLEKIGILWLSNNISPIQEHFISNLIRQKFIVAIDNLSPVNEADRKKVILFLPPEELHELGLLYCNYMLRNMGYRTIYLGQHVPLADLETCIKKVQPEYLVTISSVSTSENWSVEFFTLFSRKFPTSHLYISGRNFANSTLKTPENIHLFYSTHELKKIFEANLRC